VREKEHEVHTIKGERKPARSSGEGCVGCQEKDREEEREKEGER